MSAPESVQGTVLYPKIEEGKAVYKTVAVVGPPNAGKTTLFNRLTGLRQRVGNFPGVTVEHHTGSFRLDSGEEVSLIDLPGVYSLNPKSEDEKVTVDVLNGDMPGTEHPDAIILVLDSNNLNRHLVLAGRVIALGLPTLVLLNMADELHKQGGQVDVLPLARQLGTPVALVSAVTGEGIEAVANFLVATPQLPEPLELPIFGDPRHCREWAVRVGSHAAYRRGATPEWTRRLDSIFLHKFWGGVIFLVVIVGVFQTIFSVGQPASDLLQKVLGHGRDPSFQPASCGRDQFAGGQRSLEGRGIGAGLFAADSAALPGHRNSGGFRIPGARRRHLRQGDGQGGPERKVIHSPAVGLRMRRPGHYGHAHDREQTRPHCHHSDCAVHDLLGTASGVHHGDCGLYS